MKVTAVVEFAYEGKHVERGDVFDIASDDVAIGLIKAGRVVSGEFSEPKGPLTTETASAVVEGKKRGKKDAG